MKFQLIKPINPSFSAVEQVLTNRGIPLSEIHHYLNTTDQDINSYAAFGMTRLQAAAAALIKTVQENKSALVIVDSDCDGFTSSAVLINYLFNIFPTWSKNNLSWFLHNGKQHGLSDVTNDILTSKSFSLIFCPDSASNDYEYHKQLKEVDIQVIVLDHHEAEYISPYAIVINNQLSDYPNKDLSGVGVTWQFCRYLDNLLHQNYAEEYLDLVALGLTADMMSLRSIETKHLILKGFEENNIKNPFIYTMAEKNSFSLKGKITPMGAAFYIAPFVNSMVRSGTQEEKKLLFESMLKHRAFIKVPSTKRGHVLGETERIVDQAVRVATNVKNRQTKIQDEGVALLEKLIKEQNLLNHKILLFLLKPNDIDRNVAGLVANKFMSKYQRPCCILTRVEDKNGQISYQGSARGCDIVGVNNFKDICAATGLTMYEAGHQGAFGLGILKENIDAFIQKTDEMLKDMPNEPIYFVDYIYQGVNVTPENILDIASLNDLWGKDIDEAYIAIENLKVSSDMITLMSPDKHPTLKITLPNKISIIKFGANQEEYESLLSQGYKKINIVGKCNSNEWNGYITPQVLIENYEIIGESKFNF